MEAFGRSGQRSVVWHKLSYSLGRKAKASRARGVSLPSSLERKPEGERCSCDSEARRETSSMFNVIHLGVGALPLHSCLSWFRVEAQDIHMCLYVPIFLSIYVYMYIYIYKQMHIKKYECILNIHSMSYICMYIDKCAYTYTYTSLCLYCLCISMYTFLNVYTYIYTYVHVCICLCGYLSLAGRSLGHG